MRHGIRALGLAAALLGLLLVPQSASAQSWYGTASGFGYGGYGYASGMSAQYPSAWGWGTPQVNFGTAYTSPYGSISTRESYPYYEYPQTSGWTADQAGWYRPVNPALWCRMGGMGCY